MSSYSVFVKYLPSKDRNVLQKGKQTINPQTFLSAHRAAALMARVLVGAYSCVAAPCQGGGFLAQHRADRGAAPLLKLCQNAAPSRVLTQRQSLQQKLSFFFIPW